MRPEQTPADGIRAPRDGLSADCPILLTEQLVLRAPHVEDIDAIAILANNSAIATMVSRMPHPYTAMDAVEFVRKSAIRENGNCVYAMTEAHSGRFVGCCALQARAGSASLELGYWVGEPFWGRGFATEAVMHWSTWHSVPVRSPISMPAAGSPTRPRGGCCRRAASSSTARKWCRFSHLAPRRRWNGSGSTARPGCR